jgi:hypothetical protein
MSIQAGQIVADEFTINGTDGQPANADSLPTGTLVVSGVDNGAAVTITNKATGLYAFSFTAPTASIGARATVRINAVQDGLILQADVWRDCYGATINTDGTIRADVREIAGQTASAAAAVAFPASVGTSTYAGGAADADAASILSAANAAVTQTAPPHSGTARGGSATTIIFDTGASSVDGFYNRQWVMFGPEGTGAGQVACIAAYVGSTRTATLANAVVTAPDDTTQFATSRTGFAAIVAQT